MSEESSILLVSTDLEPQTMDSNYDGTTISTSYWIVDALPLSEAEEETINSNKRNHKIITMENKGNNRKNKRKKNNKNQSNGIIEKEKNINCPHCPNKYTSVTNRNKHIREFHKKEPDDKRSNIKCPNCFISLKSRKYFHQHLLTEHQFQVETFQRSFSSFREFENWKEEEELNQKCSFIRESRGAIDKNGIIKTQYFKCRRDGDVGNKTKLKGTCKMGASCPASMNIKLENNGMYRCTYYPIHLGHEQNKRKALSKTEKDSLKKIGLTNYWKTYKNEFDLSVEKYDITFLDFISPKALIKSIIKPINENDFFTKYWEKQPLVVKRSLPTNCLKELFSKQALFNIIEENELLFLRDLNALRYKNGKREDLNGDGLVTKDILNNIFNIEKGTVQIHQPQRFQDSLWHIMELMESYFGNLVGANVYITPSGSQGLSPHHDDVEVLILQIEGSKHWRLYQPIEMLPRGYSIDLNESDIGFPTHDIVLNPGDFLYFPRGTIHQANTPANVSHSTHITFSTFQRFSWGDYFLQIFPNIIEQAIKDNVSFRRGLPCNFLTMNKDDKVLGTANKLIVELSKTKLKNIIPSETMIEDFMMSRLPPYLVNPQTLKNETPSGKLPDENCKIRFKYPDHMCFLIRKIPNDTELDEEDEEKSDEEDENDQLDMNIISDDVAIDNEIEIEDEKKSEDECLFLYSSLYNDRRSHMMNADLNESEGFVLRFPSHYLSAMNQLKQYDHLIPVTQLDLPTLQEKIHLVQTLWSSHLLETVVIRTKKRNVNNYLH